MNANMYFCVFSIFQQVRGLTDNNNLNYRPEGLEKDLIEPTDVSPSITAKFERGVSVGDNEQDRERERLVDLERDRECKEREQRSDEQTVLDLKNCRERVNRELSTTPVDHSNNKRRRQNSSSNCDNSLTSTHSANIQERHYSQDSQVNIINSIQLSHIMFKIKQQQFKHNNFVGKNR